ncbi:hypothetical protein DFP72DRAFT_1059347 [Ephemerocybe angulata]|uniref:Secreted protein n=1 Tax=Ephemerocybe angulata TaxID=980116 RepID=A0A8H6IHE5_9AGAR|nr:hypothetical protein DFP72DRAFT_1059347 [Tulosesus angulatus]
MKAAIVPRTPLLMSTLNICSIVALGAERISPTSMQEQYLSKFSFALPPPPHGYSHQDTNHPSQATPRTSGYEGHFSRKMNNGIMTASLFQRDHLVLKVHFFYLPIAVDYRQLT